MELRIKLCSIKLKPRSYRFTIKFLYLFIECKLRAKHTAVSLWDDTAKLARDEGKVPVIALCEKNRPGFWIMVHSDDLEKIKDSE